MAAAGSPPGASQDNPIVLDDVQQVDTPNNAAFDDETLALKVTDGIPPNDSSLSLSEGTTELGREDGKEDTGCLIKYSINNPAGDGKEGGSEKSYKANALHIHILNRGNGNDKCGDAGIGSNAPASVG
ncbi:uncharacterized protein A1O5_01769 [Cladophialophora psammophila CBS 110553]|uniref:Uncharacterized protein n=1 Tax=Cladophialophora psammophila CBS 110553 TaxID=1182543 RepID=W9X4E5_9EURO|nr:uncharacterized protein A1O5_01769 [Cladophialophora psammophila CBS 110553]EXJ75073.1 hypothetical protein A1O5_01769 [Cladophialophora psammophila CBS 110553]